MPIVEFRAVSKRFGAINAVDGVSFALHRGEFFSLLGPSGCGKTTTLRLLAGFEQPDAGEILLAGVSVQGLAPYQRRLGMVFQSYALFPHLTVERNVAYGLERHRVARPAIPDRVRHALELVRLPYAEFARRRPAELSGGQRQRVALARALVLEPEILLLDEPLGALDLQLRKAMQLELKQLNRALGITFVYVTHDQEEALTMSDRIAVMDRGHLMQLGTPAEIYEQPRTAFVAGFIGESNLFPGPEGRLLAVRPERIELLPPGVPPAGWHAVLATVAEVSYLGDRIRIQLLAADGAKLSTLVAGRHGPVAWSRGAQVLACWRSEDARLVEAP
ncbi:MAG TPA: ABC transporter ATP-binding protein [Gemmatimonadales bacterium]|nr:ABC transporter ATP-binding protein [Gemmatimonadales bacterium]